MAASFCLIVGGILAVGFATSGLADPTDSPQMAKWKAQLKENPQDQSLRSKIQDEDLLLRAEKPRIDRLVKVGAWLLLGGAAVLLVCGGYIALCRQSIPIPQAAPADPVKAAEQSAGLGRLAIGWFFGILVLIAVLSWLHFRPPAGGSDLATTTPAEAPSAGSHAPESQPESTQTVVRIAATLPSQKEYAANWPRFRGPGGAGVSAYLNIPTEWDGPSGKGILWKTPIPLPGENSPIVWGNRIFLTGATPEKRTVYCLDANSGRILWQRDIESKDGKGQPVPNVMEDTGYAAPTMATDGLRVFAMFANGDLAALDFDGNAVWPTKNFGPMEVNYGYASSLTTYKDKLIVVLDLDSADTGRNALVAYDSATGKEKWRTKRESGYTWMTPAIISTPSGDQIITSANPWTVAYNPDDGKEIWMAVSAGGDVAASPVYGGGLVLVADKNYEMAAIRPDGKGNVSKTHIAWTSAEDLPDIVSPLTDGKRVWTVTTEGTIVCRAVSDGKTLYSQDLDENVKASPTLVGDKIYLLDCAGTMIIFETADQYKELGRCKLGEPADASPAFMAGRIYIRCKNNLYCVAGGK